MTNLLAIETSTELASVALIVNGNLIVHELSGVQTHSHGILPAIADLFNQAGITLQQCDAITFGCGPGAFTGVRTACGIVQGLAFGADLPILPVVSLLSMAEAARKSQDSGNFICILDARMGEVYWAHYEFKENCWNTVTDPSLAALEQVLAYAESKAVTLVLGNGVDISADKHFQYQHAMPHVAQMIALALNDYAQGKSVSAGQAQPLYLRNKIALTTSERMQLKAVTASASNLTSASVPD